MKTEWEKQLIRDIMDMENEVKTYTKKDYTQMILLGIFLMVVALTFIFIK